MPRAHAVPRLLAAVVVGAASTDDVVFVAPPRMGQPESVCVNSGH